MKIIVAVFDKYVQYNFCGRFFHKENFTADLQTFGTLKARNTHRKKQKFFFLYCLLPSLHLIVTKIRRKNFMKTTKKKKRIKIFKTVVIFKEHSISNKIKKEFPIKLKKKTKILCRKCSEKNLLKNFESLKKNSVQLRVCV